ncbi:MAG: hypothetical protein ALAOOOJD_01127 [bacterium]|nr:hypothetical protein [bacterium]
MKIYFSMSSFRRVFLLICVLVSGTITLAADRDAQVLQSNASQVTITYRPAEFQLRQLLANGEKKDRPDFENAIPLNTPGVPELPSRVFVIGVPAGARAEVSVIPGGSEDFSGVNVAPVPSKEKAEDLTRLRYTPDVKIYQNDASYPGELFKVDAPAQFRQQTIVRVQIFPVQYNPVRQQLRVYRDLQIVVRFVGGATSAAPTLAVERGAVPREEELYQEVLVNYEQAKSFRVPRSQQLFKTTNPQIEGPLYKFPLRQEGIYKIDGRTLASAGINLADVKPGTIHLYNNGGRELPRDIRRTRPPGLVENAIYVADGGDDRFDNDDYILFYGRGVDGFAFDSTSGQARHYLHHFVADNYYWLNFNGSAGTRMQERASLPLANLTPATNFKDYLFVEEELHALYESDQSWYGWLFTNSDVNRTRRYRFKLTDPVSEGTVSMTFALYATFVGGFNVHNLTVEYEKQQLASLQIPGNNRPDFYQVDKLGGLVNGDNELMLTYNGGSEAAQLYIDYFEVSYDRQLRLSDGALAFNGRAGAGPFAYALNNADANSLWLFDVSDYSKVARISAQNWRVNGTEVAFADAGGSAKVPRRYLAALPAAFKAVDAKTIVRDEVSNWRSPAHGADLVIITHEDFLSLNAATGKDNGPLAKLVSLRQRPANLSDSLRVEVVKIQDVFDEFSCGLYDPVAIRDFLKYAYDNWQRRPLFVLLVGDGDYDPKNIINKTDKNWIPTYHTTELDEILSRVTDSWFTYVAGNDETMDMAIGRIPARSMADVQAYVDKLVQYETKPSFGPWRNTAVMVADDEYGQGAIPSAIESVHILDTETLVTLYAPKYFDLKKVYLTEFSAVQSASISGIRKPTATDALLRLVNNGALLVNYAGHGNSEVWAHERVLNLPTDLDRIQNGEKQALWIAATCTFGKYDIPEEQSFSEQLLLLPGRGAIAVLATARDVYASQNAALNQQYYRYFFEKPNHLAARLGMAMVLARLQTGATLNDEKFHVLGDPSLRISIPRYTASLTAITPDTIKALTVMTVSGKVKRDDGSDWSTFNGTVRLEAMDAQREVTYQSPGQFTIGYGLPGNSLFRGEAPVSNGNFTVKFFVPKDITYGGTSGRINLYFWDKNNTLDGNGFRDQLRVGGTSGSLTDRTGPNITLGFLEVDNFHPGDVVGDNPVLRAAISDSISGVNITGEIGHKITLALDGRSDEKIDITDLFNYNSGSFTSGAALYPLGELTEGRHTVEVKAWDNLNNSSSATVDFVVRPKNQLVLAEVMNYPNPFRNRTSFTFELNFDETAVRIKIFTLSGRLIRTLEGAGNRGFNQIEWDGRDEDGDPLANGVYLYKITATQRLGGEVLQTDEIGKLAVQR